MRKHFMRIAGVSFLLTLSAQGLSVYGQTEEKVATWAPNAFQMAMYEGISGNKTYTLEYNNIEAEEFPLEQKVYLLMVDGGFVPCAGVKMKDDTVLVPVETLTLTFGLEGAWNEGSKTQTLEKDGTEISFALEENIMYLNGVPVRYDVPMAQSAGTVYVPLRLTAEYLGAKVQYISDMNKLANLNAETYVRGNIDTHVKYMKTIVIETDPSLLPKVSREVGRTVVKEASKKEYESLMAYFNVNGATFDEEYNKKYDPEKIMDTGFTMGRYYVFQLDGFPDYPIFLNQYTGEMASRITGLPRVSMKEGFMNISWLYQ